MLPATRCTRASNVVRRNHLNCRCGDREFFGALGDGRDLQVHQFFHTHFFERTGRGQRGSRLSPAIPHKHDQTAERRPEVREGATTPFASATGANVSWGSGRVHRSIRKHASFLLNLHSIFACASSQQRRPKLSDRAKSPSKASPLHARPRLKSALTIVPKHGLSH